MMIEAGEWSTGEDRRTLEGAHFSCPKGRKQVQVLQGRWEEGLTFSSRRLSH